MTDDPDLGNAYALETPEDNKRLYATWAETYDADFVQASTFRHPKLVADAYVAAGGGWPCLDVGCGTGALADHLPKDAVIDGIDISPEMLAVAGRKGSYRSLIEADLTRPLTIADATYAGLASSGTFTHGHVGPEALTELVRICAPGAIGVISVKCENWVEKPFEQMFESLAADGLTTLPELQAERIYADPVCAPAGHADDLAYLVTFRRL